MIASGVNRRAVLAALAASFVVHRAALAAAPAGEVDALRGEAYAQAAARRRALELASKVFIGDLVGTAAQSALGMRLGADTQVRLGPEAQLRVDRFLVNTGGVLELARGGMVFEREFAPDKPGVAVRSPFGLIAVRGTRFFAGPSNNVFGVFVARGVLTVIGQNTAVELTAGFGTDIVRPGAEPTPAHAWGAARIERAFASVG
jgi:hypothetical protein